ncbi:MAG TPA: hypothetical protein VMP08_23030 [Anaerolineae bacterium]|nr:hypothetical protein [Anaerolineae bacterium]
MKEPILFRRNDCLSHEQALYWKDLLYRTIKIGTEIEVAVPKGMPRPAFEASVRETLQPSGSFERLGPYGVLDVITEHAGIEVRVIGRQPYFSALQRQYTSILRVLSEQGGRPRATCGLHFHTLTPGLAEPGPEIILANTWNLVRRYAPELRFLTSGGDSLAALCRRRNYTSHLEMVRLSPVPYCMSEIQSELKASHTVPEHNNFLNLEHVRFNAAGNVSVFHLEFRFPDADLSPTSITAKTFLFLALLLKAVELSQYGVIHVGRIAEWRRKCQLLDWLSNNDGPLATSDTHNITPEIIEELRTGTRELLELLKPIFDRWEHNPSFEVLALLAETPISLLRSSGRGWGEIEALLAARASADETGLDQADQRLMRAIELAELTGCSAKQVWQWQIARELFLTPTELERRLEQLDRLRGLRWDERIGTMVFRL